MGGSSATRDPAADKIIMNPPHVSDYMCGKVHLCGAITVYKSGEERRIIKFPQLHIVLNLKSC